MKNRIVATSAAFVTLAVCYFFGVIFFFAPVAEADSSPAPLVPLPVALGVSLVLYIALFVWVAERMRHGLRAALTIALAQFLLVDVDNVLAGKRGLATAAASTVVLFVSWTAVGLIYDRVLNGTPG